LSSSHIPVAPSNDVRPTSSGDDVDDDHGGDGGDGNAQPYFTTTKTTMKTIPPTTQMTTRTTNIPTRTTNPTATTTMTTTKRTIDAEAAQRLFDGHDDDDIDVDEYGGDGGDVNMSALILERQVCIASLSKCMGDGVMKRNLDSPSKIPISAENRFSPHDIKTDLVNVAQQVNNLSATIEDLRRDPLRPVAETPNVFDELKHLSDFEENVIASFDEYTKEKVYRDQYTNAVLPTHLVEEAMREEIRYMTSLPVWTHHPTLATMPKLDRPPIKTRWVICNKGDFEKPDIRCRLVAMEVKYIKGIGGMDASLFSATPPIEAFKALISIAASDKKKILGQIDITQPAFIWQIKKKNRNHFTKRVWGKSWLWVP